MYATILFSFFILSLYIVWKYYSPGIWYWHFIFSLICMYIIPFDYLFIDYTWLNDKTYRSRGYYINNWTSGHKIIIILMYIWWCRHDGRKHLLSCFMLFQYLSRYKQWKAFFSPKSRTNKNKRKKFCYPVSWLSIETCLIVYLFFDNSEKFSIIFSRQYHWKIYYDNVLLHY